MIKNITVVPSDKVIIVDGIPLHFEYPSDNNVHAIQWHDGKGHIEYKDKTPNTAADYEAHVAPFVTLWQAEKARLDALIEEETQKPPLTQHEQALQVQMTKREFLKLIIALTKDMVHAETGQSMSITLQMIEAYVASASDEIRLEWDYATYVERKHPLLDTVSASFGISSEMLDIIFVNKDELLHKIDNDLPLDA